MITSPKLHRIVSKNGRILCLAEYHSVRQVSPNPFVVKGSTKLTPSLLRRRRESNSVKGLCRPVPKPVGHVAKLN